MKLCHVDCSGPVLLEHTVENNKYLSEYICHYFIGV